MPAKSSESEQRTDGSLTCRCGKGMSDCLIHPSTPVEWIAFMRDSLAKTLVLLESKQELLKEPDQGFTEKSCELLASLDLDSSSWKMSLQLSRKDLTKYSKTWPKWGMTQDGCAYVHPMSGRTIFEIDGFPYLATPTTKGNQLFPSMMKHKGCRNLVAAMLPTPTPTAHNSKEGGYPAEGNRNSLTLGWVVGGLINPRYQEWMMGFPIDFSDSDVSVTRKFHSKLPSPTDSLVANNYFPNWLLPK